jgi:Mg-chelatase subunit ChlD
MQEDEPMPSMGGSGGLDFDIPGVTSGGRRRGSRKGKGRGKKTGRGRKGGSFLAEITVPAALLAATQYMKGPSSYRRTKRRGSRRRNRSSQRRRRR